MELLTLLKRADAEARLTGKNRIFIWNVPSLGGYLFAFYRNYLGPLVEPCLIVKVPPL